ncbi:endonuclease [Winogradskyella sp. UBA3174]|uniref:endonuclease n=1 Tax=Winogradskyella sp. UBA3174 TaxID=1947785 RepID=UPI0025CF21C7|nr:endonuclease [Winogradskyella sp. UBA3174]|tara:strand:+ start:1451 stop:2524 length:1074 start_codon:yes stop_codon:yes gene_type:complete
MRHLYTFLLFVFTLNCFSQQAYYSNGQNNLDFTLTAQNMYDALQTKISNYTNFDTYTYGDVRDDFKIMDLDPTNSANVLLLYGFNNEISCSSGITDRRIRDKDNFGGDNCEYNREHVFARSNANPGMGSTSNSFTGIVADPYNLRATDVQRNGSRGSKKFGGGSGNSGGVGSGEWYPGDEWLGDVARTMMYMYVRYGDRCLPDLNGLGAKEGSTEMLQIYLEWNAIDPVSDIENNRNNHLEGIYGNRNPFVDNPYLAKIIWGGDDEPEDLWGILSLDDTQLVSTFNISPNPAKDIVNITISNNLETRIEIYDILGKRVFIRKVNTSLPLNISSLKTGLYLFKFIQKDKILTKKLIIQ